jgi:serine/threonine protein kinase
MDQSSSTTIGATLGKYKVLGTLGRGSMGVVYKAEDPEIGRIVAIKTLRKLGSKSEEDTQKSIQRFRTEARSAGRLRHPNIITVFDASIEGDTPYIVMDYVEGEGLDVILSKEKKLEPKRALTLLKQLAEALDEAHRQGIIHRDIKPANIVVDRQNRLYVLDFGVARLNETIQGGDKGNNKEHNKAEPVVGTPAYMSPEQIMNKPLDHRSDLFSMAIVAYELLTGKRPFPGENFKEVVNGILHSPPTPISSLIKDIPLQVEVEFEHALSKKTADRFGSAIETIRVLETAFFGKGGLAAASTGGLGQGGTSAARPRTATEWQSIGTRPAAGPAHGSNITRSSGVVAGEEDASAGIRTSGSSEINNQRNSGITNKSGHINAPVLVEEPIKGNRQYFGSQYTTPGDGFVTNEYELLQKVGFKTRLSIVRLLMLVLGVTAILAAVSMTIAIFLGDNSENNMQVASPSATSEREIIFSSPVRSKPDVAGINPAEIKGSAGELSDQDLYALITAESTAVQRIIDALKVAEARRMPGIIAAAIDLLEHDSYVVRIESLKVLANSKDRTVVPQILSSLEDFDPLVRAAAARAIGDLGSQQALAYLKQRHRTESRDSVKEEIKKAIEKISGLPYD